MKKIDLTGAKLISLLVILPLFLWFTTLNRTVLQYKELHELKNEHGRTSQGEDEILITPKINLLTGAYLFNNYLGAATSEGCDIVSFTPSCDDTEGNLSLYRCRVLVKGRFIPLLRLVNHLEEESDIEYAMLRFSCKPEKEPYVFLYMDLIQLVFNE